ncbi:nitrate- and nitrite sensing domain-containing protein [Streptomyces sp. NBC_00094]|uniref:sensor histidine kinase n=1 Tax=Streptomyces sp. NBC_00094 TaxID=2903620 RepID=UPI002258DF47|nr:nitrate- and nitrite sensing domain-containing protein [Streptomyces sp. NBC_00094]MCX5393406.1 nitrate- and nitrite sensing domain-containing protein [Streptomyces sp. NBC_00094]
MQGRFKRDGSGSPQARQGRAEAPAEQEPRAGTDRGPSASHAPKQGQGPSGDGGDGRRASAKAAPSEPSAAPPKPRAENEVGPRIALRNWRISTRLVALLTLPVVAATTLGGIRISESLQDIEQLDHMQLLTKLTREATDLAQALQAERDLSAGPLANGRPVSDYQVSNPRKKTDREYKAFLAATEDIPTTENDEALRSIRQNVSQIASQVIQLNTIRGNAYEKGVSHSVTVEAYSRLIRSLLSLSQDMAQATSNPEMIKRTRALAAFSSAKEYASIQQAIIAGALPPNDRSAGKIQQGDRLYGEAALNSESVELKSFQAIYESTGGDANERTASLNTGDPSIIAADKYAERVLKSDEAMPGGTRRGHLNFTDEYGTKIAAMNRIERGLLGDMESMARELRQDAQREAIINGALILLVLGVSLIGAFVVARSMIRSLRRLQDTATKVAQERLPELVKQLSESDPQDVDTSVESVGVHSRDEIGQVAAAFDDVHREAVRLAAEQALLRGNVNAMFTNLSRRSQGLIQRQLSLISELESREADPDQLSSLFKLDHLATRMRRNGENLLVLAGEEPGRRWTRPVPLVDVLRAAASEVEQYERIELAAVPATEVAGRVVNDLVHLLAELLENATSFSSPQTKVRVTGHALPDGRVLVEIHDTGIGLSPEDLAAINERLASPPTVDVSVSRRMGLFVVGRLSLRHGIRIQLRPSDSGGTTALVMLPVDVAQGNKKPMPKQGAGGQGAMPPGASAPGGRLPGGPGAAGGPAGGRPGGAPASAAGRLGAAATRGQVGTSSPRAALPGREGAPLTGGPQPSRTAQPQHAQLDQTGQLPQIPQAPQAPQQQDPLRPGPGAGGLIGGAASAIPSRTDVWGNQPNQGSQQAGPGAQQQAPQGQAPQGEQPGGYGFPRAELPGGNPQPQRPQAASWGNEPAQQPVRRPQQEMSPLDAPRGHEDPEAAGRYAAPAAPQGPGSTGQFPRPDFGAQQQAPQAPQVQAYPGGVQDPASTAQFARPDFGAPQGPGSTGQFPQPDFGAPQGPGSTGQFPRPDFGAQQAPQQQAPQAQQYQGGQQQQFGRQPYVPQAQQQAPQQPPAPRQRSGGNDLGAPRPVNGQQAEQPRQPQLQQPRRPEALPPAGGPGDGRTPLYDTLETNWFHQEQGQQQGQQAAPQAPAPQAPAPAAPRPAGGPAGAGAGDGRQNGGAAWRTSPNDELVRQAERVRKPAAGGVTTSGLPRRVPKANLVPGTAQEQAHTAGPQVSRAPDDVRGRLTNLRRGIQQGRQAGNSTTGNHHLGPNHQQER